MYLDLCVVKYETSDKCYLFYAPAFSIEKGDKVMTHTKKGDTIGDCIGVYTTESERDDNMVELLKTVTGAKEPLAPIIGKFQLNEIGKQFKK